jgi:hypothetical protein
MKHLRTVGFAALAMVACMAFSAGSASATTFEVGGVTKNSALTLSLSLAPGTSSLTELTDGTPLNTCTGSNIHMETVSPFTGTLVTAVVGSMSFSPCDRPVTVHRTGQFYVERIAGTTNGYLYWENGEVTEGSPFGTLNCKSGTGTKLGTVTGVAAGSATVDVKAVVNCGFLAPSVLWTATYVVTSPSGTGLSG